MIWAIVLLLLMSRQYCCVSDEQPRRLSRRERKANRALQMAHWQQLDRERAAEKAREARDAAFAAKSLGVLLYERHMMLVKERPGFR